MTICHHSPDINFSVGPLQLLAKLGMHGGKHMWSGMFPSTFVPLVPGVKNSIMDPVLKLNPVKRKKSKLKPEETV